MTSTTILLAFIAVAACGGGASKPAAPMPPPADPVPMPEPVATGEPAKAIEPASPVEPPASPTGAELLAAETAAFEKARPVFDKACAKCHAKGGKLATAKKLDHFDMTTYPFGGHHAMTISGSIRKSLGIDGSKPTMPFDKKGSVKGEDLALIAAWADAFDASHEAGAHPGHHAHGGHQH